MAMEESLSYERIVLLSKAAADKALYITERVTVDEDHRKYVFFDSRTRGMGYGDPDQIRVDASEITFNKTAYFTVRVLDDSHPLGIKVKMETAAVDGYVLTFASDKLVFDSKYDTSGTQEFFLNFDDKKSTIFTISCDVVIIPGQKPVPYYLVTNDSGNIEARRLPDDNHATKFYSAPGFIVVMKDSD